jgi:L-2-hydroxyglutarate oxidase LhgO
MVDFDIVIIGAGVIGLSIASNLKFEGKSVLVIEKNKSFGMETSSRSSEVIHAGLYYPKGSLKSQLCLNGNHLLYEICKKYNIPHSNIGKLIVPVFDGDADRLPYQLELAKNCGAEEVRLIYKEEITKLEPNVKAEVAMYCPTSGIVDSHCLMQHFEAMAINNGVTFAYHQTVLDINRNNNEYEIICQDDNGIESVVKATFLINASGLFSDKLSEIFGINIIDEGYKINYWKGIYFRVHKQLEKYPKMLIYPVPPESSAVGIHTTPDLAGGMRLGPYDFLVENINYDVDEKYHQYFFDFVKNYLPFLKYEDISPDSSGILPKLVKPGEKLRDFIIKHEYERGLDNFINLVGMDSPGITASPAVGEYVRELIKDIL